ncbi:uncharacterized protein [Drosophila kikkawai]|uniref:Uncharacterized protein n=1 Tax=Drosophila kikkawai TaxID=30033 RepID=A0A6P4J4P5_DROKI|nr:uncharacterized protein LOC108084228 [Drosophila kikkawai]
MDISVSSLNTSTLEEDEVRLGYTHDDIKSFLYKSSIGWWFPFVDETKATKRLLDQFMICLTTCAPKNLKELLDLFTLSIMMMTYQKDDSQLMKERLNFVETVSQLPFTLDTEGVQYIAIGLHKSLVDEALGKERLERVLDIHDAIPALVKSSKLGNDIAVALLLTIMGHYAKVPVELGSNNAQKAFALAKLVNWQELADSDRHADMFMLIRTFSLIINCRSSREECSEWKDLSAEIHKYFLQVRKAFDNSMVYGAFEMMVERFIAYCVVRGATATPHFCDFKICDDTNTNTTNAEA